MGKLLLTLLLALSLIVGSVHADLGPNIEDKAVKKVSPLYPPLARRKRVQGKVIISLQVNSDGTVSTATFVEGNALFKPASLDAAKQWVFNKSSTGMEGHIVFRFQLQE